MSGSRQNRRPGSARVRAEMRADNTPRSARLGRSTAQTPRTTSTRDARRPPDIHVSTKSTSNVLFTRPTTPSKTKKTAGSSSVSSTVDEKDDLDIRKPTFQFKIGMRVGVALGECFLQVQRLESSVLSIQQISDEIRDFMNFLQESFAATEKRSVRSNKLNPSTHVSSSSSTSPSVPSSSVRPATSSGASGSTVNKVKHKHGLSAGSNDPMKHWHQRMRYHQPKSPSSDAVDAMYGFERRGRNRSMSTDHDMERRSRKTRQNGNRSASPPRDSASPIPEDSERSDTITPFQQVITLNQTLERSQVDCSKRMTSLLKGLKQLQLRLEEMDDANTRLTTSRPTPSSSADAGLLRTQLDNAQRESQQYRRQAEESRRKFEETKKLLENREAQLDNDAEAIERQSEHLRADTERLLKEKEDVRRQKENWAALIEEQKELKEQLTRREQELNESQKQLIALQNNLAQKEAHLHRKAKKLRGRERRMQQNLMALRPAGGVFYDGSSYAGSDYAPSEASSKLTYFSDGDTEIASVNSLSDDDDSRYGGR